MASSQPDRRMQAIPMVIDSSLVPSILNGLMGLLYAFALVTAVRLAPWGRVQGPGQPHVYFGSILLLILLWHLRVEVQPGLSFHLLWLTAFTLMVGWSLAVIGGSLALVAVTLNLSDPWAAFPLNAMLGVVIPISLTQILLVLIRWYLPKHFFIFVLINGFLTAGFVGVATGYLATGFLVLGPTYRFEDLNQSFLPFFPLMFLPEAVINGWAVVVLVAFRPQWIYSFRDEEYLNGK